MKVSKNYEKFKINNNKCSSLIINGKNKKNTKNRNMNNINKTTDNNIHIYCNTSENNHPIESYNYSNINLNFNNGKKMIYYKNKLKKNILINCKLNTNPKSEYILRTNTIDYDEENKRNNGVIETRYNNYIYNINNTLRKNKTGLNLNKNILKKIKIDNGKSKLHNKSFKNLKLNNNKLNLYTDKENKYSTSLRYIKNNNNKMIQIRNTINKNNDYFQDFLEKEDDIINSNNNNNNNNDEIMSKELFNLLVKKLNKSIEDNEKSQKIIKKLKNENNRLKQKIFVDKKKNDLLLNRKTKEIIEITLSRDNLKKENEQLKSDLLKLKMKFKETYNNRNNNAYQKSKEDNNQLLKLDSICSSIGGINAFSNNLTEKE